MLKCKLNLYFIVRQCNNFVTSHTSHLTNLVEKTLGPLSQTKSDYFGLWLHWEKKPQLNIMNLMQPFSIYLTSIPPRHLPDTLRPHPERRTHFLLLYCIRKYLFSKNKRIISNNWQSIGINWELQAQRMWIILSSVVREDDFKTTTWKENLKNKIGL